MAYSDVVLADNPYLYWRFEETVGTNADDSSPNNRDGTYTGSPDLNQSPLITEGKSVGFSQTKYCVNGAVANLTSATVEVWLDYDGIDLGDSPQFICGFQDGYNNGVGDKIIFISANLIPTFYVYDGSQIDAFAAGPIGAGIYHLVGVIDDAANTVTMYVNGVAGTPVTATTSYAGYTVPNIFCGGISAAVVNMIAYTGRRDEFAVYSTALGSDRIMAHYQAGLGLGVAEAPQVLSMQSHVFGHNMW